MEGEERVSTVDLEGGRSSEESWLEGGESAGPPEDRWGIGWMEGAPGDTVAAPARGRACMEETTALTILHPNVAFPRA